MQKTKAFILRTYKFGEADLIVHALTQNGEKLKLFARAALKSRKRFGGGVLEPTHYVLLTHKDPKDEGLCSLHEASLLESFDSLRQNYDRLQMALRFVSLVDQLSFEGTIDGKPLFDLLGNALNALQVTNKIELLCTQFELKLLYCQGVLPQLEGAEELLKHSVRDIEKILLSQHHQQTLRESSDMLLRQYLGAR